jgi:hypothetical protein
VFSIATAIRPGTGGTFGDCGRSIPSTHVDGRWIRIDETLNARFYGARCDNQTDDSLDLQAMIDANPGGRYVLPGRTNEPVTIYMGDTSLMMKGAGWVLEGGGAGGTTMKWNAGATGIITLNPLGTGIIRDLRLLGGERFTGALRGTWPDAIMPDFTDQGGVNIFSNSIQSISRTRNVVTVNFEASGAPNNHTYVVGTQVTISGVQSIRR